MSLSLPIHLSSPGSSPFFRAIKLGIEFSAVPSSHLASPMSSSWRALLRIYCPRAVYEIVNYPRKIVHGGSTFLPFGSGAKMGLKRGGKMIRARLG